MEADFSVSSLDSSIEKNWLDAYYLGEQIHVFLDPGSIPVSYVNTAWAVKMGLHFNRLETPKRIRYPTGEIVFTFAYVELSILI